MGFLILRQQLSSVQCIILKSPEIPKEKIKELGSIPNESLIELTGSVSKCEKPTTCSLNDLEIKISSFKLLSKSESLPFTYEEGLGPDRVSLKTRLDNRVMDLRLPVNHFLIKSLSQVSNSFREFLLKKDFIEIHSPKLIEGVSEGGSEVFITDYFGKPACLAQSPQFYKQMAILADFEKVFEIGPVFRAENSNTHRHLCEFTGLDFEMKVETSYMEVVDLAADLVGFVLAKLQEKDFGQVFEYFGSEQVKVLHERLVITYEQASEILRGNGAEHSFPMDFSMEQEKMLGKLVKEKYGTDFFVVHRYPTCLRPLYTRPCEDDPRYSESFDMFLRGEEIASGSRRISDYSALVSSAQSRNIDLNSIHSYLESFKYGNPNHGGCGLGLERLVMLYFGAHNIRHTSLFPRDPRRLVP